MQNEKENGLHWAERWFMGYVEMSQPDFTEWELNGENERRKARRGTRAAYADINSFVTVKALKATGENSVGAFSEEDPRAQEAEKEWRCTSCQNSLPSYSYKQHFCKVSVSIFIRICLQ